MSMGALRGGPDLKYFWALFGVQKDVSKRTMGLLTQLFEELNLKKKKKNVWDLVLGLNDIQVWFLSIVMRPIGYWVQVWVSHGLTRNELIDILSTIYSEKKVKKIKHKITNEPPWKNEEIACPKPRSTNKKNHARYGHQPPFSLFLSLS